MRSEMVPDRQGPWWVRQLSWLLRRRGGMAAPLRIYAWKPGIMLSFLSLGKAVRRPGRLPERLKKLAMYQAARLVECAF